MRTPPDDGASPPAGRRRGRRGSSPGSHRGKAQSDPPASGPRPGRDGDSSVFLPGYDGQRGPARDRQSGGHPRPAAWRGSTADGAAGKGPVRGFPPQPGQPLPMYPPGQFAAWNRGAAGQARHGGPAGPGPAGPQPPGSGWPGEPATSGGPPGSSYYGPDDAGYSMLAVSDPAADVTSTQTWRAVAEGRATGTWTTPFRSDEPGPPGRAGRRDPAGDRGPGTGSDPAAGELPGLRTGTTPRRVAAAGPAAAPVAGPGARHRDQADAGTPGQPESGQGPRRGGPGRRLAPWSPQAAAERAARQGGQAAGPTGPQAERPAAAPAGAGTQVLTRPGQSGPSAAPPGTGEPPAGPGRRQASRGPGGQRPSRRVRRYPRSAVLIALVLVLGAGAALYFGARLISHKTAAPPARPTAAVTPTPTPTPTLGPNGHIGSRRSDPKPLTIAELYPLTFRGGGALFTRTATRINKNCADAVVGSTLQSAIGSAGCSQAVRASYLSGKMMGTIGVFNLRTAKAAVRAGRAAGASNFVGQVPGRKGPTKNLGHGNGVEEAVTKGHYLILIWAEFTDLKTPKSKAQTSRLASFMTEMLQGSANVSLSSRMADGTLG